MANTKKGIENNNPPLIISGVLILVIIYTYLNSKIPQCPDSYTQAQVDAAQGLFPKCNVGADIGTGLMVLMIVFPLIIVVIIMWILFIARKLRNK